MIAASQLIFSSTIPEGTGTGKCEEASGLFGDLLDGLTEQEDCVSKEIRALFENLDVLAKGAEEGKETKRAKETPEAIAFWFGWNQNQSAETGNPIPPGGESGGQAPVSADIAYIFEGNDSTTDTEIGLPAQMPGTERAAGGEEEKRMARMPRMEFQNDSSVRKEETPGSYLCPLENTSEPKSVTAEIVSGGRIAFPETEAEKATDVVPAPKEIPVELLAGPQEESVPIRVSKGPAEAPADGKPGAADSLKQPVVRADAAIGTETQKVVLAPVAEKKEAHEAKNSRIAGTETAETVFREFIGATTASTKDSGTPTQGEEQSPPEHSFASAEEPSEQVRLKSMEYSPGTPVYPAGETDAGSLSVEETAAAQAFEKIADSITSFKQNRREIEIQLEPERLGKLTITLEMGEKGITAQIRTADETVRNVLASQITQLAERLEGSKIQMERLDVICADPGQQESGGRHPEHRHSNNGSADRLPYETEEMKNEAMNTYSICYDPEENESSVDYRV